MLQTSLHGNSFVVEFNGIVKERSRVNVGQSGALQSSELRTIDRLELNAISDAQGKIARRNVDNRKWCLSDEIPATRSDERINPSLPARKPDATWLNLLPRCGQTGYAAQLRRQI